MARQNAVKIPPELVMRAEQEIAQSRKYNELVDKKRTLMARGKFVEAMAVGRQIEILRLKITQDLVNRVYKEEVDVKVLMSDMTDEDQLQISISLNTVLFTIDLIETCIMTTNEIIQKYHPDCKLEMYDKLVDVLKEAHKQMQFVGLNDTLEHQEIFADIADELTDMVFNKVKKYIKKKRQSDKKIYGNESKV